MTFDFSDMGLEERTRINAMKDAWNSYFGVFPAPLQSRNRKISDNVTINRCKSVVEASVAALFGKQIDFQVATDAQADAQEWLDTAWKANKRMTFLGKLGINGAVCGQAFIKIIPNRPYPRIVTLDPTSVFVEYQPDDIETITGYRIEYTAYVNGVNTQFRQYITSQGRQWLILDQVKRGNSWSTTAETVWPFEFSPILSCQNLPNPQSYWGIADLSPDLLAINRELNMTYSNIARILRYHAHPKTWVSGLQGNKLSVGPDETLVLPDGASMGALEMSSDLSSSLAYAKRLETAMDVISRTPSLALGDLQDVPRGQVTGPALELLLAPLISKTTSKRENYGELLMSLNMRLLLMAGYDETETFIHWPEVIPADPMAEAAVAAQLLALGFSKSTVFAKLGSDWAEEQQKVAEEAALDAATPAPTPAPIADSSPVPPPDASQAA
jgi:hypothetical protein